MLIVSVLVGCWFAMQDVHEFGHVAAAWLTGGEVSRVVIHPLTISRTDLGRNPCPAFVVWAGPVVGCVLPLVGWGVAEAFGWSWKYLLRFFAGFCLIANGAYIGVGSFDGIGDAGVMLRNGSPTWLLWAFGAVAVPIGLVLWHKQGKHFGLGDANGRVNVLAAYVSLAILVGLIALGLVVDGE